MYSYTRELELLIVDTLLPFYEKHDKEIKTINPKLLKQLKYHKKVPALFLPKETLA